ncbi:MAG: cation:proton antiporter [Methanothrix sp.]|nr:cation:proton antiporter [Methanothrix sp.]MDD4448494.1 cation:proton antiporter [Methanothrix sp.]
MFGLEVLILLQIAVMLAFAFVFGGLAKRLHQPTVLGEIFGGIILGPTILGAVAPAVQSQLFPAFGEPSRILHAVAYLGLIAFVFIAGLETDLTFVRQQGRSTLITSISGVILPFAFGFGMVVLMPQLWGIPFEGFWIFALFMGTALSISALPVIARILMDLDLLKTELGGMIMGAATIDDIVGWSIFALILGSLKTNVSLGLNLGLALGFLVVTACILYLTDKNRTRLKSPLGSGIMDLIALAMLAASIAAEFLGAHGIVGAFLAGVILSLRHSRRDLILKKTYLPIMTILAPIYFVSIGLKANFVTNFDLTVVLLVFFVACVGKIMGAGLGAIAGGMAQRKALAVGFGLNARGAMEIVLATAALDYGLIEGHIFVALVIMALATTMISGLTLPWLMKTRPLSRKAWEPIPLHEQIGYYNYCDN